MSELIKALSAADEDFFIGLANKGVYKRALKDIEGMTFSAPSPEAESISVPLGDAEVTLVAPLEKSSCSCISRTVCRHLLSAMLLVKQSIPESVADGCTEPAKEAVEPADKASDRVEAQRTGEKNTGEKEAEGKKTEVKEDNTVEGAQKEEPGSLAAGQLSKINTCAREALELLRDVFVSGMVRLPESISENLEIFAVRCHSLKMADAERLLRDLGTRLSECVSRKSTFNLHYFLENFGECVACLRRLSEPDISVGELGVFRLHYEEQESTLELLPLGFRQVSGGDFEGDIYYFLDMNGEAQDRFYTLSDLRPTFYAGQRGRRKTYAPGIMPWGMNIPLKSLMNSRLTLSRAKLSGGKLSSSKDTVLLNSRPASLDCDEVRSMLHYNFATIVLELKEKGINGEREQLFLFKPKSCVDSSFDRYSQDYNMLLEDYSGKQVQLRVHYRSRSEELITRLEEIGQDMLRHPRKDYIFLVSAYLNNGQLVLFPISIYDNICPGRADAFVLPREYRYSEKETGYARVLLGEMETVQGSLELILQCGLASGHTERADKTVEHLKNYGLKGLAGMLSGFMSACEAYRHGDSASSEEALLQLADILGYLKLAEEKLEIMTALNI